MFTASPMRLLIVILAQLSVVMGTDLILPLYSYPTTTSVWNPLYNALAANPTLNFTVIVNPDNGPAGTSPDAQYAAGMKKFLAYKNARAVGYVRTGYGKRSVADVEGDVQQYSQWPVAVRPTGIFFDEVNSDYYASLANTTSYARRVLGPKSVLVIYNPGTVPPQKDAQIFTAPDQVVVYESPYSGLVAQTASLKALKEAKSHLSAIVISYSNTTQESSTLQSGLFDGYASLYLTEDSDYQNFGADFADFSKMLAARQKASVC